MIYSPFRLGQLGRKETKGERNEVCSLIALFSKSLQRENSWTYYPFSRHLKCPSLLSFFSTTFREHERFELSEEVKAK